VATQGMPLELLLLNRGMLRSPVHGSFAEAQLGGDLRINCWAVTNADFFVSSAWAFGIISCRMLPTIFAGASSGWAGDRELHSVIPNSLRMGLHAIPSTQSPT